MQGNYDNPETVTYRFAAASLASTGVIGRFIGPTGKIGRLSSMTWIYTTATTVTAPVVQLGTATTAAKVLQKTLAVASVNTGGSLTAAELKAAQDTQVTQSVAEANAERFPADTVAQLNVSTAASAGAADITIVVDWY